MKLLKLQGYQLGGTMYVHLVLKFKNFLSRYVYVNVAFFFLSFLLIMDCCTGYRINFSVWAPAGDLESFFQSPDAKTWLPKSVSHQRPKA